MENKISGKVFVKEIDIGIPNLLIVAYDIDDPKSSDISNLKKNLQTNPFWTLLPGDRLGSVTTDRNGEFQLIYDDSAYIKKHEESERRPDVALFVLAPEEPEGRIDGISTSGNMNRKILYFSRELRINSGRIENYVIRIPKSILEQEKIHYSNKEDFPKTLTQELVKQKIKNSVTQENIIQKNLNLELSNRYQDLDKFSKIADNAMKDFSLSSISSESRADPSYLNPNESVRQNLETIIERDLKDIHKAKNIPLRLSLSKSDLTELGLSINSDGTTSGKLKFDDVMSLYNKTLDGVSIHTAADPFTKCKNKIEMEKNIDDIKKSKNNSTSFDADINDESSNPTDNNIPEDVVIEINGEELTKEEFIKKRSIQYLNNSPLHFNHDSQKRADVSTIVESLSKFDLGAGPADVPAYHDFYSLQFSFESIQTEIFDESVEFSIPRFLAESTKCITEVSREIAQEMGTSFFDVSGLKKKMKRAKRFLKDAASVDSPSLAGIEHITITEYEWSLLTLQERTTLVKIDQEIAKLREKLAEWRSGTVDGLVQHIVLELEKDLQQLKRQARDTINTAISTSEAAPLERQQNDSSSKQKSGIPLLSELHRELENALKQPYKFDVFAPDSVNFGLMVNYRQKWEPLNYQVGELVSTIPLAPKEERKYTKKQVIKKSRSQKEIENSVQSIKEEAQTTFRAEAEIIDKTEKQHSFKINASSGGIARRFVNVSSEYSFDKSKLSQQTKKNFRESVRKAAYDTKNERKLEVNTEESFELEQTNSGVISNPNDELPVTYLFYELQRRYRISEDLHKVTPVVLVANNVPKPNEIDEDWLISHDWVLKRTILDDSFLPTLESLQNIEDLRSNIQNLGEQITNQDTVIDDLQQEVNKEKSLVIFSREELTDIQEDNPGDERRIDTYRDIYERNERKLQELTSRLDTEVNNLHKLQNERTETLKKYSELSMSISRLKLHVKSYILYYMQAIWEYEPPDQRFFRLYNIQVPWFDGPDRTTMLPVTPLVGSSRNSIFDDIMHSNNLSENNNLPIDVMLPLPPVKFNYKKLGDIADLNNLLGYFGNYMMFPLREINYLLVFMMKDYVDQTKGGARDPDESVTPSSQNMIDHIQCLYEQNPDSFTEEDWNKFKDILLDHFNPFESEEIIVPTDSLYIEALTGAHPILEDFKLKHRAIDANKAKSELIKSELENIRLAANIMHGKFEDVNIDKKIIVTSDKEISPTVDVSDEND